MYSVAIQRRRSLCFLHKPFHPVRMSSNISRQNLQSNLAIEFRILRQIDFAHPACAKLRADFVTTEFCAR